MIFFLYIVKRFDACYSQESTQIQIYKEVENSIEDAFEGLNTTVFAYGMTGAGKTHTMQGSTEHPGIIPRVAQRVMELAEEKKEIGKEYEISASYLEIYNEKVYDLLDPKEDLQIRQDAKGDIVIPGLCSKKIISYQQFEKTYQLGCRNRTTAPTACNEYSSRSHAVVVLYVQYKQQDKITTGKIHLIDLAGSEDNRHTQNSGKIFTIYLGLSKILIFDQ